MTAKVAMPPSPRGIPDKDLILTPKMPAEMRGWVHTDRHTEMFDGSHRATGVLFAKIGARDWVGVGVAKGRPRVETNAAKT